MGSAFTASADRVRRAPLDAHRHALATADDRALARRPRTRVAAERHVDADLPSPSSSSSEAAAEIRARRAPSGALGLMQITPAHGAATSRPRGSSQATPTSASPTLEYNLNFSAWYLGVQLAAFATPHDCAPRTVDLAAAAVRIFARPNRLKRHLRGDDSLTSETERYMRWVGGMWREPGNAARSDTPTQRGGGPVARVSSRPARRSTSRSSRRRDASLLSGRSWATLGVR